MTPLTPFIAHARARGLSFAAAATAAAVAALVALALLLANPAQPHAGAQAQTTFEPNVTIFVPFVDDPAAADQMNDLAGTVTVNYAKAVTTPAQHADCTDAASETYTIETGAHATDATVGVVSGPTAPATLVDVPMDETRPCWYVATFGDVPGPPVTSPNVASVQFTKGVDPADPTMPDPIRMPYGGGSTYVPTVDIWVPTVQVGLGTRRHNAFMGTIFEVEFLAPQLGCSHGVTKRYAVNKYGVAVPEHDAGPDLIDLPGGMPAGQDDINRCEYLATISVTEGTSPTELTLQQHGQELTHQDGTKLVVQLLDSSTSAVGPRVQAFYHAASTVFAPDVSITVPSYMGENDPATEVDESTQNAFTGSRVQVMFVPTVSDDADGEPIGFGGCSTVLATYVVEADGSVEPERTFGPRDAADPQYIYPVLVDTPATPTKLYGAIRLNSDGGEAEVLDDQTPEAMRMAANCRYVMALWDFEPGSQATPSDARAYASASRRQDPNLADLSDLVNGRTLIGARTALGTLLVDTGDTLDAETTAANPGVTAVYAANHDTFEPEVTIEVPFIDGDSNSMNDLAGEMIMVSYEPDTSTAQHAECSTGFDEPFMIGTGADATDAMLGVVTAHANRARLVDTPLRTTSPCRYTATVDTTMFPITGGEDVNVVSGGNNQVVGSGQPITIRYTQGSAFTAEVEITLPNVIDDQGDTIFVGATIPVRFAPVSGSSGRGCSPDRTVTFTVTDDASLSTSDSLELVHEPAGETACEYSVTFVNASITSAQGATPAWTLEDQGTGTVTVSDTSRMVTRTYASPTDFTFVAPFTIAVPDVDGLTTGENLFAGATFDVTVTPASGAHSDCSAASTSPTTYTVQTDGSVTGTGPTLVNVPATQTASCSYDWTLTAPTSDASAVLGWALTEDTSTKTPAFTASFSSVAVAYTVGAVTFTPDVTIEVPQYNGDGAQSGQNAFTGRTISADFDRSAGPGDCTNVSEMYVVEAAGTVVAQDGTDPILEHFPDGDTSAACVYDVAYMAIAGTTGPGLVPVSSDVSTQASDRATSISYEAEASMFTPDVTIAVPFVDINNDSMNDLAGQQVTVAYEPATTPAQHMDCSTGMSEIFAIDAGGSANAGGTVTPPATRVMLVDRPQGETARCTYTADATDMVTPTGGDPVDIASGSDNQQVAATMPVTIRYSGDTFFAVTVSAMVPANETGVTMSPYSGQVFTVTFERSGGPATNCSTGESAMLTVADDASVPSATVSLVDVPDGDTDSCEYTATFPSSADSAAGATPVWGLRVDGSNTATVSASATSPSATYVSSYFTATIAAAVPENETGVTTSPYANTTMMVTLERSSGPASGCTTGASVTLTVGADATVPAMTVQLRDVPPGETANCVYTATFPPLMSADGADPSWSLRVGSVAAVSEANASVTGTYTTVSTVTLPPPVGTTVPRPGAAPTVSLAAADASGIGGDVDDDAAESFAGFVPSATQRVPISVSLALPAVSFESDASVELLVSAPGACGSDMDAFGGVPAQVGLAYAVSATSGATADVIAAGAQQLAAFAERGTQQEPCALRVTLLSAPEGCTISGASTDSAGRTYTELTWRDGTATLAVAPSLTCGGTAPMPEPEPEPEPDATDGDAADGDAADGDAADGDAADGDAADGDAADGDGADGDAAAGDAADGEGADGDGADGDAADGDAADGDGADGDGADGDDAGEPTEGS